MLGKLNFSIKIRICEKDEINKNWEEYLLADVNHYLWGEKKR